MGAGTFSVPFCSSSPSPSQNAGGGYGLATDMWSLGVLLLELCLPEFDLTHPGVPFYCAQHVAGWMEERTACGAVFLHCSP